MIKIHRNRPAALVFCNIPYSTISVAAIVHIDLHNVYDIKVLNSEIYSRSRCNLFMGTTNDRFFMLPLKYFILFYCFFIHHDFSFLRNETN